MTRSLIIEVQGSHAPVYVLACIDVHMHTHTHTPSFPKEAETLIFLCWGRAKGKRLSAPEGSVVRKSPACGLSFTRQLAVKAGQPDGEGLKGAQWVVIVEREHVISHTSKLHDYVVSWEQKDRNTLGGQFSAGGRNSPFTGSRIRYPHYDSVRKQP